MHIAHGMARTLPVTARPGFRGAAKTTRLNAILNDGESRRVAVIVDDMSERNSGAAPVHAAVRCRETGGPIA